MKTFWMSWPPLYTFTWYSSCKKNFSTWSPDVCVIGVIGLNVEAGGGKQSSWRPIGLDTVWQHGAHCGQGPSDRAGGETQCLLRNPLQDGYRVWHYVNVEYTREIDDKESNLDCLLIWRNLQDKRGARVCVCVCVHAHTSEIVGFRCGWTELFSLLGYYTM